MVPTDEREARLWFSLAPATGGGPSTRPRAPGIRVGGHPGPAAVRSGGRRPDRLPDVVETGRTGQGGGRCRGRPPERPVGFYSEVAPIALMAGDVDELRRFVSDVLSDLGVDDERCGWLRSTLREFLPTIAVTSRRRSDDSAPQHNSVSGGPGHGTVRPELRRSRCRVQGADGVEGLPVDGPGGAALARLTIPSCCAHRKAAELHRRRIWRRPGFGGYCYARPPPNPS
jgi:hypothetical protein